MKRIFIALVLCGAVVAYSSPDADAAESGAFREANLYYFIHHFTWKEFGRDGNRLLKENGPQLGVGGDLKLHFMQGDAGALTLGGKMELFGGVVDYDGVTQTVPLQPKTSNRPVTTDVNYFGFSQQIDLGWAIPVQKTIVEPFAGLDYRWWLRDLENSTSVDTDGVPFPVSGYTEYWSSFSVLLGVKSQYALDNDAKFTVTGAARYPFHNRNNVEFPGLGEVELSPGSEWSVYADASLTVGNLVAALYYENYIFPESPVVSGLYQPRSESEIVGLRVGWSFR